MSLFSLFYYLRVPQIVNFWHVGVPPNIFKALKGAVNLKMLKNTALCGFKIQKMKLCLGKKDLHRQMTTDCAFITAPKNGKNTKMS